MDTTSVGQQGRRLRSWKEIAAFFGCDERTVKRWEDVRGLPVHRVPNGSRSAVFAYEDELRTWLHTKSGDDTSKSAVDGAGDSDKAGKVLLHRVIGGTGTIPHKWLLGLVLIIIAVTMAFALPRMKALAPPSGELRTSNRDSDSAEARRSYQAGLYGWQSRTPVGLSRAVDDFTQAIVYDPKYAKAYAGLADCYNLLREYTAMPSDYAFPRAKAAAERAVALDPSLAGAHAALAFADFYWSHDTTAALREFERAIRLDPNNASSRQWYAVVLANLRRLPEALVQIDEAQQLDSASSSILADKGIILFDSGRVDEAISLLRGLEETAPQFSSPRLYLADIYRARNDDAGFVREFSTYARLREHGADRAIAQSAAEGLATGGHKGMLMAMLRVQQRLFSKEQDAAYLLAETNAQLGNTHEAMRYLRLSFSRHESAAVALNNQAEFRTLHALPDFVNLVKSAGLMPNSLLGPR